MPVMFDQNELRRLAAAGVRMEIARLTALADQLETPIRPRAFKRSPQVASDGNSSPKPRRKMSAAARKAISLRMKAHWAGVRKQSK